MSSWTLCSILWLASSQLVVVEDGERLSVSVGKDTDFELEWIENHYGHLIEAVVGEEVVNTPFLGAV